MAVYKAEKYAYTLFVVYFISVNNSLNWQTSWANTNEKQYYNV